MAIYTPYTYLIGWTTYNKWYYGARWAKNCNPSDLWVTYFTSSKYVKGFRELLGEPDIIQIRKVFKDGESCRVYEQKVLKRVKAVEKETFLNRTDNKGFNPKYWKEWWDQLNTDEREKRKRNWEEQGRLGVIRRFEKMTPEEKRQSTENARKSLVDKISAMTENEKKIQNQKRSKTLREFWDDKELSMKSREVISEKSKESWRSKTEEEKLVIRNKLSDGAKQHRQTLSKEEKSRRARKSKENTPMLTCSVCGSSQMKHHINRFHNENCKQRIN